MQLTLLTTFAFVVIAIMTLSQKIFTNALSNGQWTESSIKVARNLSTSQLNKLRAAGALDVKRPIIIQAERIGTSAERCMRSENVDNQKFKSMPKSDSVVTKIIHFQRHGQGYHNLLIEMYRDLGNSINIDDPNPSTNPLVRPEIHDSPLTQKGRQECAARRMEASMLSPELIIISPLHRAIQTAIISFADHRDKEDTRWVVHEGCREQLGLLTCNKRLPLSQTKAEYPFLDFSYVTSDD